jgi:ATP synthase F0, B subunit
MEYLGQLIYFASTDNNMFVKLGIDWTSLILQILAFVVLAFILAKFAYPSISKLLDQHEEQLERSNKLIHEATKRAKEAEIEVKELLDKARRDSLAIIKTAKDEAAQITDDAHEKAKKRSEDLLDNAKEQIERDIKAARESLRKEVIDLVILATEKVTKNVLDKKVDKKLVEKSLEDLRKNDE